MHEALGTSVAGQLSVAVNAPLMLKSVTARSPLPVSPIIRGFSVMGLSEDAAQEIAHDPRVSYVEAVIG
jgi:hypothetical protein